MESSETWPPPPDIPPPPVLRKEKGHWLRFALLLLGIGANALACLPAIGMSHEKHGAQIMDGYMEIYSMFWWIPIALIAFCVGVTLAIRQIRLRLAAGQDIFAEVFGLLLCLTPYWTGNLLIQAVVKDKGFVIIA